VGSYAGKIAQSETKTKNNKRIEGRIGVDMGRITQGAHQKGHQKLYKGAQIMRGYWWWTY